MPIALMGHCAAQASPSKIVIAGGFDPKQADYNAVAYVYDLKDEEWTTKSWTKLTHGALYDMSCATAHWFGKKRVIAAGGWNNQGMKSSELFDLNKLSWSAIQNFENDSFHQPLPFTLRSSVMAELNKNPVLAGGVTCYG